MKTIKIEWSTDDVLYQAGVRGIDCTEEQADDILDRMERYHDAEFGISWTTIDCSLEEL